MVFYEFEVGYTTWRRMLNLGNRPVTQIPQCTSPLSHNASFCNKNVHMCAHFCYKMVHCGYSSNAFWDVWECFVICIILSWLIVLYRNPTIQRFAGWVTCCSNCFSYPFEFPCLCWPLLASLPFQITRQLDNLQYSWRRIFAEFAMLLTGIKKHDRHYVCRYVRLVIREKGSVIREGHWENVPDVAQPVILRHDDEDSLFYYTICIARLWVFPAHKLYGWCEYSLFSRLGA